MQHRLVDHVRRAATRPTNRLALAALAAAAAAAGVGVHQAPESTGEPAPAGIAAVGVAAPARAAAPAPPAASAAAPSSEAATAAAAAERALTPTTPTRPKPPAAKVLDYQYQAQTTYYYCGPAATRIALTAMGRTPSQDAVAVRLNTTEGGTDSAHDTTRVLNALGKGDDYVTRELPGPPSPAQMDRLQADAVRAISDGRPIVANIVGSQTDTEGGWHGYPGGHYVTIVGYKDNGRLLKIADPAFINGQSSYWMSTIDFANWMATRGYSA